MRERREEKRDREGERERGKEGQRETERDLFLTIMLSKKSRFSFELYLSWKKVR